MSIRYIQDEVNGVTVAILDENTTYDAIRKIDKICENQTNFDVYVSRNNEKYLMPTTFKAVVRLHGDDLWDAEKGRALAKDKVLTKYHNCLHDRVWKFFNDFCNLGARISIYLSPSENYDEEDETDWLHMSPETINDLM